jgi:hypothetical protein
MEPWSDALKHHTIGSFRTLSFSFAPDGVHMKHADGRFGVVKLEDALSGNIIIDILDTTEAARFPTIEDAVADGWAID